MLKMLLKNKKKLKAITAVESLIYLVLFALIFMAVMEFVITLRGNNQLSYAKVNLEKIIIYFNDHLSDSFTNTLSIDEINSIFANDQGKIRILKADGYREYSLTGGNFSYNDNGTSKTIIDPDYTIEKLHFDKILNNKDILQGVRIEMKIVSIKNSNNFKDITTSYLLK